MKSLTYIIVTIGLVGTSLINCSDIQPTSDLATGETEVILGTWIGKCDTLKDEGDGSETSERIDLEFAKVAGQPDTVSLFVRAFEGKDCEAANRWYTKAVRSQFVTREGQPGKNNEIDYTAVGISFTPHIASEVASLNQEKPCGVSNWQLNKEVSLEDLPCSSEDRPIKKGDKGYDIYQISRGPRDLTIRFGLNAFEEYEGSKPGRSAETRPQVLHDYWYVKQSG